MKKIITTIFAAAVYTFVGGCTDDGYHSRGYGHASMGISYQDGYYDNFYGKFQDGYWDADGSFYYREASDRHFRPDRDGHFRHESAPGFHKFNTGRLEDQRRDDHHRGDRYNGRDGGGGDHDRGAD